MVAVRAYVSDVATMAAEYEAAPTKAASYLTLHCKGADGSADRLHVWGLDPDYARAIEAAINAVPMPGAIPAAEGR